MIWDFAYFADLPLQRLQERSQGAPDAVRNEVIFINDIFEVESWLILRRALNTIHESPWLRNTQNSSYCHKGGRVQDGEIFLLDCWLKRCSSLTDTLGGSWERENCADLKRDTANSKRPNSKHGQYDRSLPLYTDP